MEIAALFGVSVEDVFELIVYNHFNALKNSVIRAINLGNLSFETEFWESSGLLNCDSFSEWKEKQLENDISSIK